MGLVISPAAPVVDEKALHDKLVAGELASPSPTCSGRAPSGGSFLLGYAEPDDSAPYFVRRACKLHPHAWI